MRGLSVLALLLVGALLISGCSSKSNDTTSTSGTGAHSTGHNTTAAITNTTSLPPNIPPMVKLTVTNATGVAANVTLKGGSLTFSAVGSMDPDSDGLSAVAITAQDSNRTYPPGVLFAAGKFTPVTYTFDRPGTVNVTVSGIDGRGDLTTITSKVYVDEMVQKASSSIAVASSGGVPSAPTDCVGPGTANSVPNSSVLDSSSFDHQPFDVAKGVTFITATWVSGAGEFAICFNQVNADSSHTYTAESAKGDKSTVAVTKGALPTPHGLDSYEIGYTVDTPNTKVVVNVMVHYEPKAA